MPITGKQMLRFAEKNGWQLTRINGSHFIMWKEGCAPVSIPVHGNKPLKKGLTLKLLKQLGLR
ncbi:type II toxin-antitoxin system HicA family toxin [Enterococcus sp.]|uniref:type II toxin-antitoxin system HicA family toxin n=1 Tax=Enterococcus sp. TaxID=35783 RepID=UPI0028AB2D3D|nr:type II toxin-antitoxin system HicA family toxin [Enterococcus sp.]